jgi:polyketide synthase 13
MTVVELESWLRTRIAKVIGAAPAQVDVDVRFLDHGLDSVAMLTLTGELETLIGRELDAVVLLQYPSIAKLARHLGA